MGLSSTSALVGLLIAAVGVFFLLRKQRNLGIIFLIAGSALIFIPFSLIYFMLD